MKPLLILTFLVTIALIGLSIRDNNISAMIAWAIVAYYEFQFLTGKIKSND